MVMRSIGILISSLSVLTYCVVKAIEEASRHITNGFFGSMGWYIYLLIFTVFLTGVFLVIKRDDSEK
jgi:choline-glycine betaine transporter